MRGSGRGPRCPSHRSLGPQCRRSSSLIRTRVRQGPSSGRPGFAPRPERAGSTGTSGGRIRAIGDSAISSSLTSHRQNGARLRYDKDTVPGRLPDPTRCSRWASRCSRRIARTSVGMPSLGAIGRACPTRRGTGRPSHQTGWRREGGAGNCRLRLLDRCRP
jgi:hypothetical protein